MLDTLPVHQSPDQSRSSGPWEVTAAVVLAAGASSRMGQPKQLLPWGSTTLLGAVVDRLCGAQIDEVVVVLGSQACAVRNSLRSQPVVTVVNPNWTDGMLSSVQTGLRALKSRPAAIAIALGDQPGAPAELIDELFFTQRKTPGNIVIPRVGGRRGHPVVFDGSYVDELLALGADATLRDVVERNRERVVYVAWADQRQLDDLDTPEDYARALARAQEGATST